MDPPSAEPQRNEVTMKTGLLRLELTRLVNLGARFGDGRNGCRGTLGAGYQYLSGSAVLLAVLITGPVFGVTNWPRSFGHGNPAGEWRAGASHGRRGHGARASGQYRSGVERRLASTGKRAAGNGRGRRPEDLSQHWRRGGLGSNALVTLTLRNGNDYAVKDIEISCAFSRRDGSHLTDRTRVIHDTVRMRGRKRFARLHVGFVNVNADRAKCTLVAASRI